MNTTTAPAWRMPPLFWIILIAGLGLAIAMAFEALTDARLTGFAAIVVPELGAYIPD